MLDTNTKRRIDTARDILVGKVPDPKSQVEQITIALIYKFMDDMDAQAKELGGVRKFFAGEFEKYRWSALMGPNMGGHDILNLYSEAITRMTQNPDLPPLFRDIFKNAYLPYRDPETLRAFLKIINEFEYDHSEKLGDAFEYLLSVLGSQGDAGQFRTPRNIIDFMIEVMAPQKNETILDPACGTAGFLISAYKYILKHNSSNFKPEKDHKSFEEKGVALNEMQPGGESEDLKSKLYTGDKITPDERAKLVGNIKGFDISPDMVRLSLVNLYLHGFPDPHVFEYDTLTSDERWNEYADIILANPPFMSPKGGIKPHKRFSIDAKRSEVLFVDYIAEHLTPKGRAAVIVPEGIIFQSGTAYKALRKMLVENYLFGVVSLPAGVFNPYSGVKTSILLMDKKLAKKTSSILFVKIENDGFDLGAQRRPIDKNDLPEALRVIQEWVRLAKSTGDIQSGSKDEKPTNKKSISNSKEETTDSKTGLNYLLQMMRPDIDWGMVAEPKVEYGTTNLQLAIERAMALPVSKEKLAENGEYNLSGERYRTVEARGNVKWPMVQLGAVCEFIRGPFGGSLKKEIFVKDGYLVYEQYHAINNDFDFARYFIDSKKYKEMERFKVKAGDLLISCSGTMGKIAVVPDNFREGIINQALLKLSASDLINTKYLKSLLESEPIQKKYFRDQSGVAIQNVVSVKILKTIDIPLPPLDVQKEIVGEIEGYQKIIDGARAVVENYKPQIQIDPEWEMVELGEVCDVRDGTHDSPKYINEGYPLITSKNLKDGLIDFSNVNYVSKKDYEQINKRSGVQNGDILYAMIGTIGNPVIVSTNKEFCIKNVALFKFENNDKLINLYLKTLLESKFTDQNLHTKARGGTQKFVSLSDLRKFIIPRPPIETQKKIVEQIEKEQSLVNANKELITIFEKKIKDKIASVWGE